jgi:hypothetical protein
MSERDYNLNNEIKRRKEKKLNNKTKRRKEKNETMRLRG